MLDVERTCCGRCVSQRRDQRAGDLCCGSRGRFHGQLGSKCRDVDQSTAQIKPQRQLCRTFARRKSERGRCHSRAMQQKCGDDADCVTYGLAFICPAGARDEEGR